MNIGHYIGLTALMQHLFRSANISKSKHNACLYKLSFSDKFRGLTIKGNISFFSGFLCVAVSVAGMVAVCRTGGRRKGQW